MYEKILTGSVYLLFILLVITDRPELLFVVSFHSLYVKKKLFVFFFVFKWFKVEFGHFTNYILNNKFKKFIFYFCV